MPETNRMLNKKDLNKIFRRSYCYECSFNFVRQQHMGFIWSMAPALKKIYKDDPQGAWPRPANVRFRFSTPHRRLRHGSWASRRRWKKKNKKSDNTMGEVVSAVKNLSDGSNLCNWRYHVSHGRFSSVGAYYRGTSRCGGQLACYSTVSSHLQYPAFSVPLFRHPPRLSMGQRLFR